MQRTTSSNPSASDAPLVPARGVFCALAYLVDAALTLGAVAATYWFYPSPVLAALTLVEIVIVLTIARAATGYTVGALVTRSRALSIDERRHAPGLTAQLIHTGLMTLLHITVIGPLIVNLLAKNGQSWPDRVAKIVVLRRETSAQTQSVTRNPYGKETMTVPRAGTWSGPSGSQPPGGAAVPTFSPSRTPSEAPHHMSTPEPPEPPVPPVQQAPAHPAQQPPTPPPTQQAPVPPPPSTPKPSTPKAEDEQPPAPYPPLESRLTPPKRVRTPPPQEVPSSPPLPQWVVFDSGEREEITGTVVIGRAPSAHAPDEKLLTIADTTRSLSRTHLRVMLNEAGLWIEDTGSANGTRVTHPNGETAVVKPGTPIRIETGTTIRLGERTATITSAPE